MLLLGKATLSKPSAGSSRWGGPACGTGLGQQQPFAQGTQEHAHHLPSSQTHRLVLDWSASHSVSTPLGSVATTMHFLGVRWAQGAVRGSARLLPVLPALSRGNRKPCFPEGPFGGAASFPVPLTASFSSHVRVVACAGEEHRLCQPDPAGSPTCWPQGLPRDSVLASHEPGAGGPWVSGRWVGVRARLTPGVGGTQVVVCTRQPVFTCCCLARSLAPQRGLRSFVQIEEGFMCTQFSREQARSLSVLGHSSGKD